MYLEQGFDYVEIYTGTTISGQPLYRFTGTTLPSTVTISGNAVLVRFVTDGSNVGTGWAINYTSSSSSAAASCSGTTVFTSSSGSFADRSDASSLYTNNLDCRWLIQPASGATSFTVSFSRFQTETCCDYVEIYAGTSVTGTPVYRFSGTTIPATVTVNGSVILVRFVTDGSAVGSGWALNYTSSLSAVAGCSGTTVLSSASGSFADRTNSSSNYINNLDCRWLIQPSAGASSISLSFSRFDVESGFDYVEIYSLNNVSGQPLYRFTGTTLPSIVTVSGSLVLVRFITNASNTAAGWGLSYSSTPIIPTCSGTTIFTSSSGSFADRTTNVSSYTNNLDCRWLIQPSAGAASITATFSRFETESCCDYVEIYTGTTVTGTPAYRFAGSSIPSAVTVNSAAIVVRFVTDGSVTGGGWALSYTSSSSSSGSGVSVQLPAVTDVRVGNTFTIPITVSNLTDLNIISYQCVIAYNSSAFTLIGGDIANTLSNGMTVSYNTSVPGQITVVAFGSRALSGSGTLINLSGRLVASSGEGTLSIRSIQFNEGMPTASIVSNGSRVRIGSALLCGDVSQNGSISALDAALVAQHVSGTTLLSGLPLQAADVSGNRQVTSFDAALIAQFVDGTITSFPGGCPPPTALAAVNNPLKGGSTLQGTVAVELPRLSGRVGSKILIPVNVGNVTGESVLAYTFRLSFDPTVLRINGVLLDQTLSSGGSSSINTANAGEVRVAYFTARPLTGQGVLLNLDAEVIGAGISDLKFSQFGFNEGMPSASTVAGALVSSLTSVMSSVNAGASSFNVYPNPTREMARIEFEFSEPQAARIAVFNSIGAEVARLTDYQVFQGRQHFDWDAHQMTSGVYTVRLQTSKGIHTQLLHIVR